MIKSNNRKVYEVTVKTLEGVEVITVGASSKDEAIGIVKGRTGVKNRDILEVI